VNDPLDTIEAVARAYDIRWLVLERDDAVAAAAPILEGDRPAWIGPPVAEIPRAGSAPGDPPEVALYPVCLEAGDARCAVAP
jgi:hypothetical protein